MLFEQGIDYGDKRPEIGDLIEMPSGMVIKIDDGYLDEKDILIITKSTLQYLNFRTGQVVRMKPESFEA